MRVNEGHLNEIKHDHVMPSTSWTPDYERSPNTSKPSIFRLNMISSHVQMIHITTLHPESYLAAAGMVTAGNMMTAGMATVSMMIARMATASMMTAGMVTESVD